jgi:hypothetical protein
VPTAGLFPLPAPEVLASTFRDMNAALARWGYHATSTLPYPGGTRQLLFEERNFRRYRRGQRNAHEGSSVPDLYYRHFGRSHPEARRLFETFALERPVTRAALAPLLGDELVDRLIALQILVATEAGLASRLVGDAVGPRICFHDWSRVREEDKPHRVFLGRCSMRLADRILEAGGARRFRRSLDLCTGSGVQALLAAARADAAFGGDVNERALAFARANAVANGVHAVEFRRSDLFSAFDGRYDLVTANTPFLMLNPGSKALDGYGGHLGMEVELRLFEALDDHLEPGGLALIVASSVTIGGRNLLPNELARIFAGRGYRIALTPISSYYDPALHPEYRKHGVDVCTLYVVELRKEGTELHIDTRRFQRWSELVYAVNVRANHLRGWMRERRSART